MLSDRIKQLRSNLLDPKREISLERSLIYMNSYKESEGLSSVLRRAYATKAILEKVSIEVNDLELIVGNRTIKPRSGIASPEMSPYWILDEMKTMEVRPQDQFIFNKEDQILFEELIYPYYKDNSLKDYVDSKFSDEVKKAIDDGVVIINQTDKGQGHIIPNFEKILNVGVKTMINDLKLRKEKSNNDFLDAALITLEAFRDYINRYYGIVLKKIENELDKNRKLELIRLSDVLDNIINDKPSDLYEAIQLFWLLNIALQYESNASSISSGRFDQYMYPFYLKSINNGESVEFLSELLRDLWLKMNDVVLLRSEESAKFFGGFPTGYTIILGGVLKNGRDATNELSYLVLDTFADIKLPQPNLGVRVHEKTPQEFLIKTAKTIRLGTGIPQLFNDEVIIPGYLNRGVSLEDARDYAVVGCVELSIPGKTYGLHDIALFNLLKVLEITLNESHKEIDSFEMLLDLIKANIDKYIKFMVEGSNICDLAHSEVAPTPFLSNFIDNCIESGLDVSEGGAIYNFSGVQGIGTSNLSDSLEVIKQVVFNEKLMSLSELNKVLNDNFKDNEILRQRFINKYDKFGNDIDDVDYLGSDILSHYGNQVSKYKNVRNGIFQPGSYTVSAHIPLGEMVNASADGRLKGEQLADGGLSPMVGRDKNGPTSVLKSVSKLDNYLTTNGSLLNVKLTPSVLADDLGLRKFVDYIKGFMRLKLQHIQFNIVSIDTLKKAQENPLEYRDLVIRVAGYSAIFVELNKAIQDDIINRTEHGF